MSEESMAGYDISGIGLVTPAGPNASASCCALRAGQPRFSTLSGYVVAGSDGDVVEVEGAVIPGELPVEKGVARMTSHARCALREAVADAGLNDRPPQRVGLFLGHDSGFDPYFLVPRLLELLPGDASHHLFPDGRCAALTALSAALEELDAGRIDLAVVGSLDSWVELPRLISMDQRGLLQTPAAPEGILPGEAAGFVVLDAPTASSPGPSPGPSPGQPHSYARVMGAGRADESTGGTEEPCRGEGLTSAVRIALASAAPEGGRKQLPLVLNDLNGDHYRAMEWGLASVRSFRLLEGETRSWEAASLIGDCGAGSGIVNLVWAAMAMHLGYALSPEILLWGASEGRERAAALVMPAGRAL